MSKLPPKFKVFHSDQYDLPLPEGHRFPMEKYSLLRKSLVDQEIIPKENLIEAPLATKEDILRAHSEIYFQKIESGSLNKKEQRLIGFPWSPIMIKRSRASVGGFIAACESAIEHGVGGNLSGGTHHSFFDHGEGFCVFNDFAVAALKFATEKQMHDILILDLDVHQGNGNAAILSSHPEVFVCSFHGKTNYPYKKQDSDLDIAFEDNTEDEEYLQILDKTLKRLSLRPWDLILYQAGVDGLKEDKLGKLSLSLEGLFTRDKMVLQFAKDRKIPIALGLGGGYCKPINKTIEAHRNTYRAIREIF